MGNGHHSRVMACRTDAIQHRHAGLRSRFVAADLPRKFIGAILRQSTLFLTIPQQFSTMTGAPFSHRGTPGASCRLVSCSCHHLFCPIENRARIERWLCLDQRALLQQGALTYRSAVNRKDILKAHRSFSIRDPVVSCSCKPAFPGDVDISTQRRLICHLVPRIRRSHLSNHA
jgi:hypothetical protein